MRATRCGSCAAKSHYREIRMDTAKIVFSAILLLFLTASLGFAQSRSTIDDIDSIAQAAGDISADGEEDRTAENHAAPTGFAAIEMGMELSRVKEMLKRDPQFNFRGDPDVSLLARPNESLIETEGISFVDRAYFQFYEGKLYTIIIVLNPDRLDHYSMYSLFVERYGEPSSLDPTETIWEFDKIRMVLERPLSVKYIDTLVFNDIVRQNAQLESLNALSRDQFLDQF